MKDERKTKAQLMGGAGGRASEDCPLWGILQDGWDDPHCRGDRPRHDQVGLDLRISEGSTVTDRQLRPASGLLAALLFLVSFPGCGPSVEELIRQLASSPDQRLLARQELLLAKERAVTPLVAALDDPDFADARMDLCEVLISLMVRVEDPRITEALLDHLGSDPNSEIRARIARLLGVHLRREGIDGLLQALQDESGEVRYQAMLALGSLEDKLSSGHTQLLQSYAQEFIDDPHPGVRTEALIRIEGQVLRFLQEADKLAAKAQLTEAESLYTVALSHWPASKQANFRLARFYRENGEEQKGLQVLREHGMLFDVPRFESPPVIDGLLNEPVWQQAARADTFYQYSRLHKAALPSDVSTHLMVGRTAEALFIGFRGDDAHPDSLVVKLRDAAAADTYRGGSVTEQVTIWTDDITELFIDANFDRESYGHFGINSIGVVADEWILSHAERRETGQWNDPGWQADIEVAAHVGEDYWSLECRLPFDVKDFPQPQRGAMWGFNVVRVFRGQEYSQWVRTFGGNAHTPDQFGVLVFE